MTIGSDGPRPAMAADQNRTPKKLAVAGIVVAGLAVGGLLLGPKVWQRLQPGSDDLARRAVVAPFVEPASVSTSTPITVESDIDVEPSNQPVVPIATSMTVSVVISGPDNVRAMQLSQDPSFVDAEWQRVDSRLDFVTAGTGYQSIFVRFLGDDGEPGPTSVTGVQVDPTYQAATSSASGQHQPSWVRPLTTSELVVRVEAGRLLYGSQEPYNLDELVDGDKIITLGGRKAVERNGETYGFQVSQRRDAIKRPDRLIGRPLPIDDVVAGSWAISNSEESAVAIEVDDVRYLGRPSGGGIDQDQARIFPVVYDIVLALSAPIEQGQSYVVQGPELAPIEFVYEPDITTSPAIRVNQVGFAPNDQLKVAYLSGWFDGLGATVDERIAQSDELAFRVVDIETGVVAFRGMGQVRLADAADRDEMGKGDLTGASVAEFDFGQLTTPGTYRLCVDDVGCSYEFAIKDFVWDGLAAQISRAMYHQRSGTDLGPPYTSIVRPRPYHPDEDTGVTASDYSLIAAQTETNNTNFAKLADESTGIEVPQAWGGHFDAGDWDRRIQHLWYARTAAEMVLQFPGTFDQFEMNIPESGDEIPDLLDEALWTVDLFHRMQRDDGAIRGGIEASEHPLPYSSSWSDDLAVYAYEPDAYSSYIYAGTAAEVAHALKPYDSDRAQELLTSAQRAMAWAESRSDEDHPLDADGNDPTAQQRHVAAAGLLLATGDQKWHDLFVETADYLDNGGPFMSCHAHYECDGAWMYLLADPATTDADLRADLGSRFIESADGLLVVAASTGYGWSPENPFVPLIWGLGAGGSPHTSGLMKAHYLTNDDRYRNAAVRAASVTLGANPMNRSMITGLGHEPPAHPLIVDVANGGLPLWSGTPVYGYHSLGPSDEWVVDVLLPAGAFPHPNDQPYLWQWYDVVPVAQFNEFTVHQSHADALSTFASLAATS